MLQRSGKPLNVRDASAKIVEDNQELKYLKQILGLRHGYQYQNAGQLRYGKLMLMTDQDHDGSHIKGLLINLLHHLFPSLLHIGGFLQEFITPIVKVGGRHLLDSCFRVLLGFARCYCCCCSMMPCLL